MEETNKQELVVAVILNYNSILDTKKCVGYLCEQTYHNFKIVVVDNHSTESGQIEELNEFCLGHDIELILSNKNGGFSAGNNIGIRRALEMQAKWVLIINPDVEIRDTNYVEHIMNELSNWSRIGVAATKVLLPNGENQNPMRELTASEEILFPIEILKQKYVNNYNYKTEEVTGICEKVAGCCFLINAEFLVENGLLDEHVFMYCEEPILAKSLTKRGYRALYIDELVAYHQHFSNKKEGNVKKRMITFLDSRKYYVRKYSDYGLFARILAILVRDLQILIWKVRR